jgi:2',3'-cyclic-nucleotide 2'-phosphodiesterase (5'-nucleotidase family)
LVRRANFYNKIHDTDANWLTLDAGNFIARESGDRCSPKCDLMIQSFKLMKYDGLNLGSTELSLGYDALKGLVDTLGIPLISANLVDARTNKTIAKPYVIRRYGNMTIGVLGLMKSEGSTRILGADSTRLKVLPQMEVAKVLVPKLDAKTDAVVLLCDLSTKEIDTLLQVVPQIAAVISTGPLVPGTQATRIRGAWCAPTGSSGHEGTALTLEFNPAWGDSIGESFVDVQLTGDYDGTNEITRLVEESEKATAAAASQGGIKPAVPRPMPMPGVMQGQGGSLSPQAGSSAPSFSASPTPANKSQ